jgi:hypothetical protein
VLCHSCNFATYRYGLCECQTEIVVSRRAECILG